MKTLTAFIITGAVALALGVPVLIGASAIKAGEAAVKPAAHVFCHDEMICTPIYGCRWVTICD